MNNREEELKYQQRYRQLTGKQNLFRTFLFAYAVKKNISIEEYLGPEGEFFCCLERIKDTGEPHENVTAFSPQSKDHALAMAFLAWMDPDCNFLPDSL